MGAEQLSETLKQFTLTAQYTRIYPTLVLTEGAVHPVV
jgi:histone acetyltransferase (RNA polymerase elongator complex component)